MLVAIVQVNTLDAAVLILLLVAGLILLALLYLQERRAAEPIVPFQLWRNRIMAIGNIGNLVIGAMLMCIVAFLPTYMQGVMGRSVTVAGAIIGGQSVAWSVGSILSGAPDGRDVVPDQRRHRRTRPYRRRRALWWSWIATADCCILVLRRC